MIRRVISKFFKEFFRVGKTTAFRFSFLATLVASIITGISMMMIYQTARQEISTQVDTRLMSEAVRIRQQHEYRSGFSLHTPGVGITERVHGEPAMSYCIAAADSQHAEARRNFILFDTGFGDLCTLSFTAEEVGAESPPLPAGGEVDMMRVVVTGLGESYTLIVGYDTQNERRILRSMFSMALFATGLLIVSSLLGSYFISHSITQSTRRISRAARNIVDGDFGERISVGTGDSHEMRSLAADLNHMLERIDTLISSQRQVTNNIAHDMRSPLNRLRSRLEVVLIDRNRSVAELRESIGESIEDIERLLQTFNAMLTIAQIEARARDDFIETDLSAICEELGELYEIFTEDSNTHTFSTAIAPHLAVYGNRQLIAQAVSNLLDNAIKYTPDGGHITLEAQYRDRRTHVFVSDNGKGIPAADRERVLQRFVRLDSARSTPGNGLGLSMVAAVMTLHGGELKLHDNKPGLRIELIFPNVMQFRRHAGQRNHSGGKE